MENRGEATKKRGTNKEMGSMEETGDYRRTELLGNATTTYYGIAL